MHAQSKSSVFVLLHYQETGLDLIERIQHADEAIHARQELRTYGIGSQILVDVGVGKMRLMTAPRKIPSVMGFGLEITGYCEAT